MTATYDPDEVERLVREARAIIAKLEQGLGVKAVTSNFLPAMRAMADQLEAARGIIAGLSPDAIQALVDENDRLRKGFDEIIGKLQNGSPVQAGFCCWCGQHWPHLDGESFETLRKYTADHAETCPAHDIRIARDAARARIAELEARDRRLSELALSLERAHHPMQREAGKELRRWLGG